MVIQNDTRQTDSFSAFPKAVAAPLEINTDTIREMAKSQQPDEVKIAVMDSGLHGKQVSFVAERASLSSMKNVRYFPSAVTVGDIVSGLEKISENPGNIRVVNYSSGSSVASRFMEIFAAQKTDFTRTFGSNPARWTPSQKEAIKTRINGMLTQAKSKVDKEKDLYSDRLSNAFKRLHDKGITVVTAAGNGGQVDAFLKLVGVKPPAFLSDNLLVNKKNSPYMIVVGASTTNDNAASPAKLTSRNAFVDVAADGTDIRVGNNGATRSGTSFSAPQVAGLVADLYAKNPRLTPKAIGDILKSSTLPGTEQTGKTGAGVVNRAHAIKLARAF